MTEEHRIRWYARVGPCVEAPDGWLPRRAKFRGMWGWDVRCSCGLETRTGGGTTRSIRDLIWAHRWDVENGYDSTIYSGWSKSGNRLDRTLET